jgi:hypothetical protein
MSEYRLLCPQCGQAFQEGTSVTECPQCRIGLLQAIPAQDTELAAALANLPGSVDVNGLMKRVLAEQGQGEPIDAALQRVLAREHQLEHKTLYRLVKMELSMIPGLKGMSEQEAAERLSRSDSRIRISATSNVRFVGSSNLSPEQREEVEKQIEQAMAEGKPFDKIDIRLTPKAGKSSYAVVLLAVCLFLFLALWASGLLRALAQFVRLPK